MLNAEGTWTANAGDRVLCRKADCWAVAPGCPLHPQADTGELRVEASILLHQRWLWPHQIEWSALSFHSLVCWILILFILSFKIWSLVYVVETQWSHLLWGFDTHMYHNLVIFIHPWTLLFLFLPSPDTSSISTSLFNVTCFFLLLFFIYILGLSY